MSESTQQSKPEPKREKGTKHKIATGSADAPDVGRPVEFAFTKAHTVSQGKGKAARSFATCAALVLEVVKDSKPPVPSALKLCVPGGGVERVVAWVAPEKGKPEPAVVGTVKLGKDELRFMAAPS